MPNLGDYIGHLLSEITIARMHADLEAVRVAELYVNHPLLRHMPVPRFRLPNVEMDIPVAIKKAGEQPANELPRGTPKIEAMRTTFDTLIARHIEAEKIQMKPAQQKKLKLALDKAAVTLAQPAAIAVDVMRIADEWAAAASAALAGEGLLDKKAQPAFEEKLREEARRELIRLRTPPPRLEALVTTGEIREAGPGEVLTHIRLKIVEEAFEWTSIESDGKKKDRLIIE